MGVASCLCLLPLFGGVALLLRNLTAMSFLPMWPVTCSLVRSIFMCISVCIGVHMFEFCIEPVSGLSVHECIGALCTTWLKWTDSPNYLVVSPIARLCTSYSSLPAASVHVARAHVTYLSIFQCVACCLTQRNVIVFCSLPFWCFTAT